jgi:hypothetical protein
MNDGISYWYVAGVERWLIAGVRFDDRSPCRRAIGEVYGPTYPGGDMLHMISRIEYCVGPCMVPGCRACLLLFKAIKRLTPNIGSSSCGSACACTLGDGTPDGATLGGVTILGATVGVLYRLV